MFREYLRVWGKLIYEPEFDRDALSLLFFPLIMAEMSYDLQLLFYFRVWYLSFLKSFAELIISGNDPFSPLLDRYLRRTITKFDAEAKRGARLRS